MKQVILICGATLVAAAAPASHCNESAACKHVPTVRHWARMGPLMEAKKLVRSKCHARRECPMAHRSLSAARCDSGSAGEYSCDGIDLQSMVSLADLGSSMNGNDVWGWTDSTTGKEYAIMGAEDGTSFVDVSSPTNPVVLGWMPSHLGETSIWRDIKTYKDHAFIGAEATNHGIQVFDLTRLRTMTGGGVIPRLLEPDVHYDEFGNSHNLVINEDSGFLYAVGTRTFRGGPHVVDIRDPKQPRYVGGFEADGYTHDAQCVNYHGPDARYEGAELCFCYNEESLTIVDVTDKTNMRLVARRDYQDTWYTHQGWLTEDHTHLLLNDETDEVNTAEKRTRTLLWNVVDLEQPRHIGNHMANVYSIDHNLYTCKGCHGGEYVYMSNYCSGLRVVDIASIASVRTPEKGWFDVAPYCNTSNPAGEGWEGNGGGVRFAGTWSNYPWFRSGNILVSSMELGLFVVKPAWARN